MKWCWGEKGGGTWGGMIFRKGRRDSDGSGRTMIDSVLAGSDVALATGFWAATATGVITRTHTFSLPICHFHSLALTQYYPSHHSSCVIPLRDTNWTLSLHDCLATWLISHPSFEPGVRKTRGGGGNEEGQGEPVGSLVTYRSFRLDSGRQMGPSVPSRSRLL